MSQKKQIPISFSKWDSYWKKDKKTTFGFFASLFRNLFLAPTLARYFEKYMPDDGIFAECGSGTSESSSRIKKKKEYFIAVDFSKKALFYAKKQKIIDKVICANIKKLPFKNEYLDGIWNLGVMEHFKKNEIVIILNEFNRVLRKNGRIILFWPHYYGSVAIMTRFFEFIFQRILKKKDFKIFPDMPSQLKNKKEAKEYLKNAGFKTIKVDFPIRGFLSDFVVIGEKT
jgi:SAM-dependent methyltransferase